LISELARASLKKRPTMSSSRRVARLEHLDRRLAPEELVRAA
jgi:hypothetical protein